MAKSKALAVQNENTLVIDLPENSDLHFDPLQNFDWRMVYKQEHLNVDFVSDIEQKNNGRFGLLARVTGVTLEVVQDPNNVKENKAPDLCLVLDTGSKVVMNKTRCHLLTNILSHMECERPDDPRYWVAGLDGEHLEFHTGVEKRFSPVPQVLIRQASASAKKAAGIIDEDGVIDSIDKDDAKKLFG